MRDELKQAIEVVKNGGVIIYATDTACGIGCRIDNEAAVERIFTIKGRDAAKATPVLFSSVAMVKQYVTHIPEEVQEKLMNVYWPGALTIILEANTDVVFPSIRGGGATVGTRIPDAEELRTLIEEIGVPLIGTSANFSGEPSIYTTDALSSTLISLVDYVLPGECQLKQASTVIDCTQTPWNVVRKGGVSL